MDQNKHPGDLDYVAINGVSFTHKEMFSVIDDFYHRIQIDEKLKIPFQSVHDWPEHIERLTHFWWCKFGGQPYLFTYYNPVEKHFFAGFNEELLARWLNLFHATMADHLADEQMNLWKRISQSMGEALNYKNNYYKAEYEKNKKD